MNRTIRIVLEEVDEDNHRVTAVVSVKSGNQVLKEVEIEDATAHLVNNEVITVAREMFQEMVDGFHRTEV